MLNRRRWVSARDAIVQLASRASRLYPPYGASRPDPQRGMELAQRGDHRQGDDAAGFRVVRWHVLDRQREARRIRVDLDGVAIALDGGVGPDVDHGAVGADAGQR